MKLITLRFSYFLFLLVFFSNSACKKQNEEKDYTKFANPFIGNAFTGHTSPVAAYPLGLVQAGPETGNFSWQYCSGYVYGDSLINGFSQTRLNGTGCVDLGDLLIQPFSGEKREDLRSRYDAKSEKASPGYYTVFLTDNNVKVEVTASPHVALYRCKYKKGERANLLVDFQSGLVWNKEKSFTHVQANEVTFENETSISGFTQRTAWVEDRIYFFVIEFSAPIVAKELLPQRNASEKAPRYILSFDLNEGEELKARIALSSTSVEGAKENLRKEINSWDFDNYRNLAKNKWNDYLSLIEIEGSEEQKKNIYTALYHMYVQPNNIADSDGKFMGVKNEVRRVENLSNYYSTLSQWDTFRAAFPLYTILSPELIPDLANSMIAFSEEQGHLPIWGLWGRETYTMIANHSVPMIVDACLKGFPGIDVNKAYEEVKKSLTVNHPRSEWDIYDKYGYYPFDLVEVESVSRTLESGYNDYNAYLLAKTLGKEEDAAFFLKRSNFYKNVFDPTTKTMRARDTEGNWRTPFDPFSLAHGDSDVGGDYTEANALQYTWHVLQDIPGLIELMGNKELALGLLDSLFFTKSATSNTLSDVTGLIGQYAHGNEPSHHIAYIYNYLDQPWKTQELIRKICTEFYKATPDGLIGNDDCGQMSAWYVFSCMGFYPVDPVSGSFVFGAPQIKKAKIKVREGKFFTMRAKNLSEENEYVEKIELNGEEYNKKEISYESIMNGGDLVFYMSNKAQKIKQ